MNFDDHEIWNRPVPETSAPQQSESPVTEPAPTSSGRLYASAGAPAHPDAIVALPNHTRSFVSVAELPEPTAEPSTPSAPASSATASPTPEPPTPPVQPRPVAPIINDPAIAEVLAPADAPQQSNAAADASDVFAWAKDIEVNTDSDDPFKDWYADPQPVAELPATPPAPAKTGLAAQQLTDAALRARTQLQDLGDYVQASAFTPRAYFLISFIITSAVGIVDVLIGGTVGMLFGIALLGSTSFSAWKLQPNDRWIGWVMPAYVAIAAILVAGQFGNSAPGFNLIGQGLLVGTTLISIAPWLAGATAIGAALPRLRKL